MPTLDNYNSNSMTRKELKKFLLEYYGKEKLLPLEASKKLEKAFEAYIKLTFTNLISDNINDDKFFALFTINMIKEVVHDPNFAPAAVSYAENTFKDTFTLYLNPYKILMFNDREFIAVITHELLHISNNHIFRY
ncbi:hypothetical protein FPHOBKDP_00012 [Listeria phage LPJP1]|nr:hypothetical protein FPHOBKDP_00012 [Listeria phage LPJP1]